MNALQNKLIKTGYKATKWSSNDFMWMVRKDSVKVVFEVKAGTWVVQKLNGRQLVWKAEFTASTPLAVIESTIKAAQ